MQERVTGVPGTFPFRRVFISVITRAPGEGSGIGTACGCVGIGSRAGRIRKARLVIKPVSTLHTTPALVQVGGVCVNNE